MQADLRARVGSGEVPREVKDAPFVQIPLGVTEDRRVGTVDIEASMKVPCFKYVAGCKPWQAVALVHARYLQLFHMHH